MLAFALDFFFTQVLKLSLLILTDGRFFTLLSTKAIFASVIVPLVLLGEALRAGLCLGKEDNKELYGIFHVFDSCLQSRNIHCYYKEVLGVCQSLELCQMKGWKRP